jgi:putative spermidine/putrescine transport system ATP-binding protein
METLRVDDVSHWFGNTQALNQVSFSVHNTELVALLGPSGCGKTTLLRMIAGFVQARSGRIVVAGQDITRVPPYRRNVGMVFQNYALFPHMTVAQNVTFGLEMRNVPKTERSRRVAEVLRLVRLEDLPDRFPRQLSGGQQQRVAIARALVIEPEVFLLDEPLSNLDAKLRQSVGREIRALQRKLGLATVFVTHDQSEAMTLADRLVLLNKGEVVQEGTADELYHSPVNSFVANFLGHANLIPGRVAQNGVFITERDSRVSCDTKGLSEGASALLCLRPEHVELHTQTHGEIQAVNVFPARVGELTFYGEITEYELDIDGIAEGVKVRLQNRENTFAPRSRGETCQVRVSSIQSFVVPEASHV